jgi:thiol-disulfide isomerase/thioredoxin
MADYFDADSDGKDESRPTPASALSPSDRIQPSKSFAASSQSGRFRLPAWTKLAIVAVVAALGIGGRVLFSLHHKNEALKARTVELDPAEVAARERVGVFQLLDAEGKPKGFELYKGQVVILSFWASWCGPCLSEMPTFVEVERKFRERGLRVVAVDVDEDAEGRATARDFWKSKAFAFPTFFDLDRKLQGLFRVDMLPSNIVFDRAGRVAFKGYGANDWANPQTLDLLEQLLLEPLPGAPGSESPSDQASRQAIAAPAPGNA